VPLIARVREELQKAEEDKHVRALIVRINSPGGTITASDVLYHELLTFKNRKKVPVIAAIMDVGASGGYYAALAADTIVANPTTITGSIGVVMVTVNAQGLLEKIGVAPLAIKSGPMKDAGSPFRSMTEPERAVFQGIIDDMYGRFLSLIVQSRKLPEDRVRGAADGRVYTAEQALRLGLVDRIGYLEDVVSLAKEKAGVSEARVIMYHRPKEYRTNIYSATPAASTAESTLAQFAAALGGGDRASCISGGPDRALRLSEELLRRDAVVSHLGVERGVVGPQQPGRAALVAVREPQRVADRLHLGAGHRVGDDPA
jgi:protease-4